MTEERYKEQIAALSILSGIDIQVLSPARLYQHCTSRHELCQKELCQSAAQNAAYYAKELNQSCIYLCPARLCRMVTPGTKPVRGSIFSGPFVTEGSENHTELPLLRVSLEKIYALSEIQFVLAGNPENTFFSKEKEELQDAIKNKEGESISRIYHQTTQKIFQECGMDLYKIKFYCCRFAMILWDTSSAYRKNTLCLDTLLRAESTDAIEQEMKNLTTNLAHAVLGQSVARQNIAIDEAVMYVQKNYAKKISQQDVAKAVFLSPSYFSHLFQKVKGIRFMDFVNRTRIERAKEMLQSPVTKPETVYLQVGYQSRSYFIKTFKKITGMSPERYRKQYTK